MIAKLRNTKTQKSSWLVDKHNRHNNVNAICQFFIAKRHKFNFFSLEKCEIFSSRWSIRGKHVIEWAKLYVALFLLLIAHSWRRSVNRFLHSTTTLPRNVVKWSLHHVVWIKFLTNSFRGVHQFLECAKQTRFLGHKAGWRISNVWGKNIKLFSARCSSKSALCIVIELEKRNFLSLEWWWRF